MATTLPSSCVKNNKAIIWMNIRTTVMLKARKARKAKAKQSKKPGNEKWSGNLMCNLIDEYEARPVEHFL